MTRDMDKLVCEQRMRFLAVTDGELFHPNNMTIMVECTGIKYLVIWSHTLIQRMGVYELVQGIDLNTLIVV